MALSARSFPAVIGVGTDALAQIPPTLTRIVERLGRRRQRRIDRLVTAELENTEEPNVVNEVGKEIEVSFVFWKAKLLIVVTPPLTI